MLWLRIASDLVLRTDRAGAALGAEFETRFSECLEFADESARLAMAKKLCGAMRSPGRIVQSFLGRSDAAAAWTLAHAPSLPPEVLRQAAGSRSLSRALAERDDLDEVVVDELLATGDAEARIALARNVAARLTRNQLAELVTFAREFMASNQDFRLASALLGRSPMSLALAPLFLVASPTQRTQILLAAQRADLGRDHGAAFAEVPEQLIADLERHALERQAALFDADLAAALDCSQNLASRIAGDPSGEPLAVALAAIRAPNEVCVRILTSRDMAEGPDYRRLGALARLQGALSVAAARAVISAVIGNNNEDSRSAGPQSRHRAASQGRGGAEVVRLMRQRQAPRGGRADLAK
jgi:uncharacterized protein (DUF2336 family)